MSRLFVTFTIAAAAISLHQSSAHSFDLHEHVEYDVGGMPHGLAADDLDGDGDIDVVTANVLTQNLSVLLNHGNGTFADAVSYPAGAQPRSIAVGDVDQDGDLDLVVGLQSGPSVLAVLLNNGTGSFSAPVFHGPQPEVPDTIVLGLINADADLDAAVVQGNTGEVLIFRGRAGSDFHNPVTYTIPANALNGGLAASDLDQDGDLDLTATFIYSFGTPAVLLNDGNGSFALAEPFNLANSNTPAIEAGFIDDQPGADIIQIANSSVQLFLNDGTGSFGPMITFDPGVTTSSVTRMFLEDLDGNGKPDVLISGSGFNELGVLLNDGAGNLGDASQHATGAFNSNVIAAELNGDGFPDVIATNRDGASASILLNATSATSVEASSTTGSFVLAPPRPNPSRSATRISYAMAHAGHVAITIHDVAGRLVTVLSNKTVPAGDHSVTWDGRTSDGRMVSAGVYSVRMEAPGFSATERMVRLR